MKVYHVSLESKGFFAKADKQPSGGGVLTSPYLHDFMLNFAFYEALRERGRVMPEDPQYLDDLKAFFEDLPIYVFPAVITGGIQKTESLNVLPSTRCIPERGSKDNVPQWNAWLGYKNFKTTTTLLAVKEMPLSFYIRLGKKRTPVKVSLTLVQARREVQEKCPVGVISPFMHLGLRYAEGTLIRMNPSPLFIGKVEGEMVSYKVRGEADLIHKPLQFKLFEFSSL